MSFDSILSSVSQIGNSVSSGLNLINRVGADLGLGSVGGNGKFWKDSLTQASFRGVPFAVKSSEGSFGRRNAVHEYPFRDSIWVEDMGRSSRRFGVQGFLVENSTTKDGVFLGGVIEQRNKMIFAAEASGDATLQHPTIGEIVVSLLDFKWAERWDLGRVVEITFMFAESGQRIFPVTETNTVAAVYSYGRSANLAAAGDWQASAAAFLNAGVANIQQVVNVVQSYATVAQHAVNDATNLANMVKTLSGQFGRFVSGQSTSTVSELSATAAISRVSVNSSITAAAASAAALSASSAGAFPESVQSIAASIRSGIAYPGDALTALASLAGQSGSTGLGAATADLMRRSAVVEMANASADYQPTSHEDAAVVMSSVAGYLDAEILTAGDQGEDATYQALRSLRVAVINDLTARGASLAGLTTITSTASMPALALAQRVYQDASRADELVTRANPIHPLFMPTSFEALST